MGFVTVLILATAVVAVGFYVYLRSQSEVRQVEDFKNGLEKISPDAMPEVSSEPAHPAENPRSDRRQGL